jgi:hypothetical protein
MIKQLGKQTSLLGMMDLTFRNLAIDEIKCLSI